MATGMARGARQKGVQIAFGDGKRIIWGPHSEEIFRFNPNIAKPGTEKTSAPIQWIAYYKGHRLYNQLGQNQWVWNYRFKPIPGEMFFNNGELLAVNPGSILIEPNIPAHKSCARNKQWALDRYQKVTDHFRQKGIGVYQFDTGPNRLAGAGLVATRSFREAMAIMHRARLAIVPEGGLHHAAAALGVPAVVIFGGFVPPEVTGYDAHINLVGSSKACGSLRPCPHCRKALDAISVDQVISAAESFL